MRTFLKIFVTVLALVGGFAAYVIFQPASAVRQATTRPAPQALTRNGAGLIIGEGENAWVRQFDDEGRLASRFRAAKWEPEKNGLVRVIRPEAELLLKGGKDKDGKEKPRPLVRIRGDDGEVVVQSLPDAAAADKPLASSQGGAPAAGAGGGRSVGPAQPPSSGRLNGVVIDVFETEDAPQPRVTLRTNNIVFDNDTFCISTESYRAADGSTVPADEVEVSVTGPDFEFYGRGLTVRWNDLEERLDLLRIAHGDHLVAKNVEALSTGGLPLGLPAPEAANGPSASAESLSPISGMLASADRGTALALAAADRRPRGAAPALTNAASKPARRKPRDGEKSKDDEQPPYRAAFNEDVRVVQGDQQLATAGLMNIDFVLGQRKTDRATTRPSTGRRQDQEGPGSGATTAQPLDGPAASTKFATAQDSAKQSDANPQSGESESSTQPTTSPAAQPVTVYWTGELTVTPSPLPAAPAGQPATAPTTSPTAGSPAHAPAAGPVATAAADEPLPPGEARVELVGAPAVLTRDLLDVKTARFVYRTDGRVTLDNSAEFPRVLITQRPADGEGADTTVSTEGLTYARGEQIATLRGESRVLTPIDSGAAGAEAASGMIDASWRETAAFRLVGQREDELWVEHAAFVGKVDVKAPQGVVRSERLELSFDPPAVKPAPAAGPTTAAAGAPHGPALADGSARGVDAAPQSSSPNLRRVLATDNVYCELVDAKEGKRLLECQRLALDTARSEAGELYPRTVDASGVVHAATAEQELDAGHVLLQLRLAKKHPATQPAAGELGDDAKQPLPFSGRAQWALADAGAAGLAGASRPKKDETPSVELESMAATDAVRVAAKDGGVATGRRLLVTVGDDNAPRIELTGDPARVEHARGSGTLTGPRIEVDPKTGVAHVVGPGTLRAVQRDEDESAAAVAADAVAAGAVSAVAPVRPVEVTWADGADVRGADDRIDISGAVSLWITDADGSVRTATAGRVSVELAPKPAERPAEPPQGEARAAARADANAGTRAAFISKAGATRGTAGEVEAPPRPHVARSTGLAPDDTRLGDARGIGNDRRRVKDGEAASGGELAQSMNMDLFKNKEVSKVHLYDDAVVNSKLAAGDGSMLRQFHLRSQAITYDARSRHLAVPGAGQMLVEVHEPAATGGAPKQAKDDGRSDDPAALAGGNGVTAFEWARAMEYDESAGRAVMDGSVVVSHQPDKKNDPPVRVDADTLTALFETRREDAGGAESAAGSTGEDNSPRLQLRSMIARGNIVISREGSELGAYEIRYDPATEWVIARGTGRNPATYTAPGGAGTVRAGELWLNTKTWQVKVKDVNTRVGGIAR